MLEGMVGRTRSWKDCDKNLSLEWQNIGRCGETWPPRFWMNTAHRIIVDFIVLCTIYLPSFVLFNSFGICSSVNRHFQSGISREDVNKHWNAIKHSRLLIKKKAISFECPEDSFYLIWFIFLGIVLFNLNLWTGENSTLRLYSDTKDSKQWFILFYFFLQLFFK